MWARIETELDCSAEAAWEEVQKPALLEKISKPLVIFEPEGELPQRWREGETVKIGCKILGVIPMGVHTIHFESIDDSRMVVQTREHDATIKRWDHRITIESVAPGRCRYRDEVDVDAGVLTPVIWAWARVFYEHRQRGWRKLASGL